MKYIPIQLLDHYQQEALTTCRITRVLCKDGTLLGFTDLDVDVPYDPAAFDPGGTGDDWGFLVHKASSGAVLQQLNTAANLSVDNTNFQILPGTDSLSVEQALNGFFDLAQVRVYRLNYLDTGMGHECVAVGQLGQTTISQNIAIVEYRSLTDLLKQPESDLYSIVCAHKFGDAPFCPKPFDWTNGTVNAVDPADALRVFADSTLTPDDNFYVPGVVEWLTGDNAGRQMEVDQNTAGTFALALPMNYAIQLGDTFRVRQDCSKIWQDGDNGCLYHWADERFKYFGGFPDIPVADGGVAMIPGGQVGAREED